MPFGRATTFFPLEGVDAIERRIEFPRHFCEPRGERRAPPDQHVIVARLQFSGLREPHDFPQPAPYPVTLDRLANLTRHCEADAHGALVRASAGLQHERARRRPRAGGGGAEIRPSLQPLQYRSL